MKKIFTVMLLCVTAILASCQKDESITPISGVTVNKTTLTLVVGAKETLTATIVPESAIGKRVAWSSSNESVATISENGEVVAVSAGKSIITVVSVVDKSKTATCLVTVTNSISEVTEVTEVTLNKQTLSLLIGSTETLVATLLPAEVTDKRVTWSSSNAVVATVSENGEVTAIAAGTATITVTSVNNQSKTSTCLVTVTEDAIAVTLVGINNKPLSMLVGGTETLLATVLPDNATDKNLTWSSDDVSVATVSTMGEVVAVGTGVATITVASVSDNTKTDQCVVTVTAPVVTTTAVGNYYYSDKSQTLIYDRTKTCLGVVFWVDPADNQKGTIVSLDEVELAWSDKQEVTGANNNSNGRANMYLLNEFIRDNLTNLAWENYPAFKWVAITKNGRLVGGWDDTDMWHLPAQGDLVALFGSEGATVTAVNASLNAVTGAVALTSGFYCSSTEVNDELAKFVPFSGGNSDNILKWIPNKVRAVAAF